MSKQAITLKGARENNLKNVCVQMPRNAIVAVIGVSGSGKSSLLFRTLAAESAVRHEAVTTNAARRSFERRPDVDAISGLPYCSVVSQRAIHRTSRSTVATFSGIHGALRSLTIAFKEMRCHCGTDVSKPDFNRLHEYLFAKHAAADVNVGAIIIRSKPGTLQRELTGLRNDGFESVFVQPEEGGPLYERRLASTKTLNRDYCNMLAACVGKSKVDKRNRQQLNDLLQKTQSYGIGESVLVIEDRKRNVKVVLDTGRYWPCPKCNTVIPLATKSLLSFNSEESRSARCNKCEGIGSLQSVAITTLVPDPTKSIDQGCFALVIERDSFKHLSIRVDVLRGLCLNHGVTSATPFKRMPVALRDEILNGAGKRRIKSFNPQGQKSGASVLFHGFIPTLEKLASGDGAAADYARSFASTFVCDECDGTRFDPRRTGVYRFRDVPFTDYLRMKPVEMLDALTERSVTSGDDYSQRALTLIMNGLQALKQSGLSYIRLDRSLSTLSGGELQRLKIAGSLCSGLTSACYILDEPSLGLHASDNTGILNTIRSMRDMGNTILIADHDPDFLTVADFIVELGPEGGVHGGEVVRAGPPTVGTARKQKAELLKRKLLNLGGRSICVSRCSANNLKNVDVTVPLGGLICLTGVSGSGKSSFAHQCLHPAVTAFIEHKRKTGPYWKGIKGANEINHVASVGQQSIGTSSASLVVTYLRIFDRIRELFARTKIAVERDYSPSYFSHNRPEGRCPTCAGRGEVALGERSTYRIECSSCEGGRFADPILDASYRGYSIASALQLAIDDAIEVFDEELTILRPLELLKELGLGYLQLGRSTPTLSGGEAQRLKLASSLSSLGEHPEGLLFILDEPTAGLHHRDVQSLIRMFDRLIDGGRNTLVIIEHNIAVIGVVDHIIDFGPNGGDEGGKIVYAGTPAKSMSSKVSKTGQALKSHQSSIVGGGRSRIAFTTPHGIQHASGVTVGQAAAVAAAFLKRTKGEAEVASENEAEILTPTYDLQEGASRFPLKNRTLMENLRASEQMHRALVDLACFPYQASIIYVECEGWFSEVAQAFPTNSIVSFSPVTAFLESRKATRSLLLEALKRSTHLGFSEFITSDGLVQPIEGLEENDLASVDVFDTHVVAGRIGATRDDVTLQMVTEAFATGGGWVMIRSDSPQNSSSNKCCPLYVSERPLDVVKRRVGRRRLVPAIFDSRDVGGCPYCRGTGIQITLELSLLLKDRRKSPLNPKSFTIDCMKMLKATWNRCQNAMLYFDGEGLVPFSNPKLLSADENWGIFLHGYPWAKFLIAGRKGTKNVDYHEWPGLVPLVLGRLHLATNQRWSKQVEQSKTSESCYYCKGTGFDWLADFYLLDGYSVADWLSEGTHDELLQFLKATRCDNAQMLLETLRRIVRIGLGGIKIAQRCQEFSLAERSLARALVVDILGLAEATYLVDAVSDLGNAAMRELRATAKDRIVVSTVQNESIQ